MHPLESLKTLVEKIKRKSTCRLAIAILLVTLFVICFTFRLIPEPISDRAIWVSVAEYLLSGSRLYTDIYDNKDPLFLYAVSMQRLLKPIGEYLFELSMVVISTASAYNISCRVRRPRAECIRLLLLIAVPLLVTGHFWDAGLPHLPSIAFSLLACSLYLRKKVLFAGACIGLVLFINIITFILPAAFCLTYELFFWNRRVSRRHITHMAIGFMSAFSVMIIILLIRDELAGYLQNLQSNFLYANSVLIDNSSFINSFASHLRAAFLGTPEQVALLPSLIVSMGFSGYIAAHAKTEKKIKAFSISIIATYITSIAILGSTALWDHHLQLMYFPQTLLLICIAVSLNVVINFNSEKFFSNSSLVVAIVVLSVVLSGTLDLRDYVVSPREIRAKISYLTHESPETNAFRAVYQDGIGFARLGQNTNVIPYGAVNDKLLCPHFHQYPFDSLEKLRHVLDCTKTAPVILVDSSFELLKEAPNWWPRESQEQVMLKNWNHFVAAGESILKRRYSCKRLGDIRICSSVVNSSGSILMR